MAWMDFEKFQTRSGNEPRAAALERKVANEWMGAGYTPSVTPYWQRGYRTENEATGEGYTPGKFSYEVTPEPNRKMPSFQEIMKMWQEEENFQGGGAVGLEPGIGSLMGYAKGGMVTKVEVPKGQTRWMKKFMNNMRDS